MTLMPVTPEEMAWVQAQPVPGAPSLSRLAATLRAAGWEPLELVLSNDAKSVDFSLRGHTQQCRGQVERENALRTLIRAFRQAGFNVGFTELAIDTFTGESLSGSTLVGPLEQVCRFGPVPVAL